MQCVRAVMSPHSTHACMPHSRQEPGLYCSPEQQTPGQYARTQQDSHEGVYHRAVLVATASEAQPTPQNLSPGHYADSTCRAITESQHQRPWSHQRRHPPGCLVHCSKSKLPVNALEVVCQFKASECQRVSEPRVNAYRMLTSLAMIKTLPLCSDRETRPPREARTPQENQEEAGHHRKPRKLPSFPGEAVPQFCLDRGRIANSAPSFAGAMSHAAHGAVTWAVAACSCRDCVYPPPPGRPMPPRSGGIRYGPWPGAGQRWRCPFKHASSWGAATRPLPEQSTADSRVLASTHVWLHPQLYSRLRTLACGRLQCSAPCACIPQRAHEF